MSGRVRATAGGPGPRRGGMSVTTLSAAPRRDVTHAASEAVRFFSSLYAEQTGMLELRTVPLESTPAERQVASRLRDFVPVLHGAFNVHRIDRFLQGTAARGMAAYFGVALRTQTAGRDRKGGASHCHRLTALFVDADFKHLGEPETRRRLGEFPIPPSIIVNSGGGLHPYWLLRTPIDLQRDYRSAQSILRRVAKAVADIVDVGVSEPARVLRVPGSFYLKSPVATTRGTRLISQSVSYGAVTNSRTSELKERRAGSPHFLPAPVRLSNPRAAPEMFAAGTAMRSWTWRAP